MNHNSHKKHHAGLNRYTGGARAAGFSLLELLIVLMIIGIVSAFAYPAYQRYLLKSHRTDAMSALTHDQMVLERCYAQNFSYNATCSSKPAFPHNSDQAYYSIALSNLGASSYTLTATAIGNQTKDTDCMTFIIDHTNTKSAKNSAGTVQTGCW